MAVGHGWGWMRRRKRGSRAGCGCRWIPGTGVPGRWGADVGYWGKFSVFFDGRGLPPFYVPVAMRVATV